MIKVGDLAKLTHSIWQQKYTGSTGSARHAKRTTYNVQLHVEQKSMENYVSAAYVSMREEDIVLVVGEFVPDLGGMPHGIFNNFINMHYMVCLLGDRLVKIPVKLLLKVQGT